MSEPILTILERTFQELDRNIIYRYFTFGNILLEESASDKVAFRKKTKEELLCILSACLILGKKKLECRSSQIADVDSIIGRRFYYPGLDQRAKQIPVLVGFRGDFLEFEIPLPETYTGARGPLRQTCNINRNRFLEISGDYSKTNSLTKKQRKLLDFVLNAVGLICSGLETDSLILKERMNFELDILSDNVNSVFRSMSEKDIILPDDSKIPMSFLFPSIKAKHITANQPDESHLLVPVINFFSSVDHLLKKYSVKRSDLLIIDGIKKAEASASEISDSVDTDILPPTICLYEKLSLESIRFFNNAAFGIFSDSARRTSSQEVILDGTIPQMLGDVYVLSRELHKLQKSSDSFDSLYRAKKLLISTTIGTEELKDQIQNLIENMLPNNEELWRLPGNLSSLSERIMSLSSDGFNELSGVTKSNYLLALLRRNFDIHKSYGVVVNETDKEEVERIIKTKDLTNVDVLFNLEGRYDKEYEEVYFFFWTPDHIDDLTLWKTRNIFHILYPLESKWKRHHIHSFKPVRFNQYIEQSQSEQFEEDLSRSIAEIADIDLESYLDSESSALADTRNSNFEGFRIDLSNGKYYYATDRSKNRRINYVEEIIESVSPNDLEVGDTIVFFTGTDMEIIDSVVKSMVERRPDKYFEIEQLSTRWKDALEKVKYENVQLLAARLRNLGYKHPSQTIRRWKDDSRSIRPQKLEVIDLIAEFTEDEEFCIIKDKVKAACKAAMAIRLTIGKYLISRTTRSFLDENDQIAPEIEDIMNSGSLVIAEITTITRESNIPGNLKNRLFESK